MTSLVADVGGTNTRFAITSSSGLDHQSIKRFANEDYTQFEDVLNAYLQSLDMPTISSCAVAVAGPLKDGAVRLTNLDWEICIDVIKQTLSCENVQILNDLTALGFSLAELSDENLSSIQTGNDNLSKNGQALVIGIGTGFNVCPVKKLGDNRVICLEAECGHSNMPEQIITEITSLTSQSDYTIKTVEELFSGRGFSNFHAAISKSEPIRNSAVIEAFNQQDPDAQKCMHAFAQNLGVLTSDLILKYLPLDGIYFSGGVARQIFVSGFAEVFLNALKDASTFNPEYAKLPISVISDDYTPLMGCTNYLHSNL